MQVDSFTHRAPARCKRWKVRMRMMMNYRCLQCCPSRHLRRHPQQMSYREVSTCLYHSPAHRQCPTQACLVVRVLLVKVIYLRTMTTARRALLDTIFDQIELGLNQLNQSLASEGLCLTACRDNTCNEQFSHDVVAYFVDKLTPLRQRYVYQNDLQG